MSFDYEVFVEEGDFRIARVWSERAKMKDAPPKVGRWVCVQHRCDPEKYEEKMFSDKPWSLCRHEERTCFICDVPVPPKIVGFHEFILWNNEMDNY